MVQRVINGAAALLLIVSVQAAATGRISGIQAGEDGIRLEVETTPGGRYKLQCAGSLVEAVWQDAGPEFVAVSNVTVHAVATEENRCYMRVVRIDPGDAEIEPPPPPVDPPPPPETS